MSVTDWREVSKGEPCPLCGKPDWCKVSSDGDAVLCGRSPDLPAGWARRKPAKDGRILYVRERAGASTRGAPPPRPTPKPSTAPRHLSEVSDRCRAALGADRLDALARDLGVRADALRDLAPGWASPGLLAEIGAGGGKGWSRDAGAFTFPERDGEGRVVGLSLRAPNGAKGAPSCARRGLVVPADPTRLADPLLIVEGASDVAACLTLGLAAVGRPSNVGGADDLAAMLRDRRVMVVGERDERDGRWPGRVGAVRVTEALASAWGRPVEWTLPPSGAKDVRAWVCARVEAGLDLDDDAACRAAGADLLAELRSAVETVAPSASSASRPDVLVPGSHNLPPDGEYREVGSGQFADDVLAALPAGTLYRREGEVGEVREGRFHTVEPDRLREIVDARARLCSGGKAREPNEDGTPKYLLGFKPCSRDHAGLILARAATVGTVRELDAITTAPVLLPSGDVLADGYDAATRTLCVPAHEYPEVPRDPTDADARAAWRELMAPFDGFQIASAAERASIGACMLALVARTAIAGNVPAWLVTAPAWRVGKGLLVECMAVAMTGFAARLCTTPGGRADDQEAEWSKRMVATLRTPTRAVLVDNLRDGSHLRSDALAAMLTAPDGELEGRDLGLSRMVRVRNGAVWIFTGCNVTVEGDLAGRMLGVRLVCDVEDPAARTFEIPDLAEHVRAHHPRLVVAALTVLRRFVALGCPQHGAAPLGGFIAWDRLVRSAVVWITALSGQRHDPLDTQARLRSGAAERDGLGALLTHWHATIGTRPVTARELLATARTAPDLGDALATVVGGDLGTATAQRVGIRLDLYADRVRGELVLRRAGERHRTALWTVSGPEVPHVPHESPQQVPHPGNRAGATASGDS